MNQLPKPQDCGLAAAPTSGEPTPAGRNDTGVPHPNDSVAMLPQQGNRILWLVRSLTILGLSLVLLTTGLIGWTLARVRQERARAVVEQEHLEQAARALRETATACRLELHTLLDETATVSQPVLVADRFDALVHTQLLAASDPAVRSTLHGLDTHAERLGEVARRAEIWRTNYLTVWDDLRQQRTLGRVRAHLALLRSTVEALEGQRHLAAARQYYQWRQATGSEAARLATAILLDQADAETVGPADFKAHLAELARLAELLAGEENLDHLADLKENQIRPALERLASSRDALVASASRTNGAALADLESLRGTLLGQPTVAPAPDGLFALRQDALRLRRQREQLKTELADLFHAIEAANGNLALSTQARAATLTRQMEASLVSGWWRLLVFGGGCAAAFLWLAGIISRGIKAQVKALEQARFAAEQNRQAAQQLMCEQQAAAAQLAVAHQELQVSEQRFRTFSTAAPIGIFATNAAGQCTYTNPCWQTIAGQSLEASLGDGWSQAVHPEDRDSVATAWRQCARHGREFDRVFRFCHPSGEIRWAQARSVAIRTAAQEVISHVGTVEDITERRRAEESLRLQEAALRSAANVVVITDCHGDIVWTNPAFTQVTGYTAAEAVGRNPRLLQRRDPSPPYPLGYYQELWATISRGDVWHGEFHNSRKDGSAFIEEATITPVRNAHGELTHFVAVKQNITERKRAEADLAQAQKDLLEVSRQAGMAEVATTVLHNVGNVLNSVNVSAACVANNLRHSQAANLSRVATLLLRHQTTLAEFFAHDPKGRQLPGYLAHLAEFLAAEQTNALKELTELQKHVDHIKDIVSMQQSLAGVSGLVETVPVTELIEDALRMNASALARHDIQVVRNFDTPVPVTVEKHKVLQILVNVIRNAKQSCDAAHRDTKQMTLSVVHAADHVRIAVTDNGVGIPPENLTRIFHHGFTTKAGGHGFALHSGANAAREMGGALRVQSDGTGTGATFTLELPLQPTRAQA